jgi:basic membrane protein A
VIRIALLLPGEKNDLSWNQAAYEALVAMAQSLNQTGKTVTISVAEGMATPSDILPAMQAYAQQNYNFIIGDGYQNQAPASQIAAGYPNTGFLIANGYQTSPNQALLNYRGDEIGFLMGAMASLMSKSGKVAIISGENVGGPMWVDKGFLLGVQYVNQNFAKNVTVINTFVGNFNDPVRAKTATVAAINQGADVVFNGGDGITEGVAAATRQYGVPFLYNEFDQTSLAPNNTYGGVIFSLGPVLKQAVLDWLTNHTFQAAGTYWATFQNGGLTLKMGSNVPQTVVTVMNVIYANVASGKIEVYQLQPNGTLLYNPVTPAYSSLQG